MPLGRREGVLELHEPRIGGAVVAAGLRQLLRELVLELLPPPSAAPSPASADPRAAPAAAFNVVCRCSERLTLRLELGLPPPGELAPSASSFVCCASSSAASFASSAACAQQELAASAPQSVRLLVVSTRLGDECLVPGGGGPEPAVTIRGELLLDLLSSALLKRRELRLELCVLVRIVRASRSRSSSSCSCVVDRGELLPEHHAAPREPLHLAAERPRPRARSRASSARRAASSASSCVCLRLEVAPSRARASPPPARALPPAARGSPAAARGSPAASRGRPGRPSARRTPARAASAAPAPPSAPARARSASTRRSSSCASTSMIGGCRWVELRRRSGAGRCSRRRSRPRSDRTPDAPSCPSASSRCPPDRAGARRTG